MSEGILQLLESQEWEQLPTHLAAGVKQNCDWTAMCKYFCGSHRYNAIGNEGGPLLQGWWNLNELPHCRI